MSQQPLYEHDPKGRRRLDFYRTDEWMTHSLIRRIQMRSMIYEPCAGDGAIANVLRCAGFTVATNDIDPAHGSDLCLDATKQFPTGSMPWVVTNPPFTDAFAIVQNALRFATDGVAMMLRLSWLEPTAERQDFLSAHPPTRMIVLPRHAFRGGTKTDSVTSAWCVWSEHVRPGIEIVTKRERDVIKAAIARTTVRTLDV